MKSRNNFLQSWMFVIFAAMIFGLNGCSQTPAEYNQSGKLKPQGYISFTSVPEGGTDIFLYDFLTANGYNLTNLGIEKNEQSAISPDATKIAFVSQRDGTCEIYVMNRDGNSVKRLTDNTAWDVHPAWSPDGTKLAFVITRDGV
jgi:TolB protein